MCHSGLHQQAGLGQYRGKDTRGTLLASKLTTEEGGKMWRACFYLFLVKMFPDFPFSLWGTHYNQECASKEDAQPWRLDRVPVRSNLFFYHVCLFS